METNWHEPLGNSVHDAYSALEALVMGYSAVNPHPGLQSDEHGLLVFWLRYDEGKWIFGRLFQILEWNNSAVGHLMKCQDNCFQFGGRNPWVQCRCRD